LPDISTPINEKSATDSERCKIQWCIGNTTVRSPYRLQEALQVLADSYLHGNLSSSENENAFARLLHEKGIVNVERLNRDDGNEEAGDLGRKWRSAMAQLGFVVRHNKSGQKFMPGMLDIDVPGFPMFKGNPYEITPNGHRLIRAQTVAGMQEAFLRALLAYRIPSLLEKNYDCRPFSPLRFVTELLLELENNGQEAVINGSEMALIVQQRSRDNGINALVSEIIRFREARDAAPRKKIFDRDALLEAAGDKTRAQTWKDYADTNFRYLKATGLFQNKSRGISLVPEKETLAHIITADGDGDYDDFTYIARLWKGAVLPTDDKVQTVSIVRDLYQRLTEQGEPPEPPEWNRLNLDELNQLRYLWEDRLMQLKEIQYARAQVGLRQDIAAIMKLLTGPRASGTVQLTGGDSFSIPSGEAPAYFEWVIWRAFLAMGGQNPPWKSRNFHIDQDFLPVSHAGSGKPDLKFDFDEYVLVVEVTLTLSSRQEAAEGEPVRRHVAQIAELYENSDKRVYCLFIAPRIDSNTAETFKNGNWYKSDDSRLPLHIVPVSLEDFIRLFEVGRDGPSHAELMKLLIICRSLCNSDAPQWKAQINQEISRTISRLKRQDISQNSEI